jgi:hypothetical protein
MHILRRFGYHLVNLVDVRRGRRPLEITSTNNTITIVRNARRRHLQLSSLSLYSYPLLVVSGASPPVLSIILYTVIVYRALVMNSVSNYGFHVPSLKPLAFSFSRKVTKPPPPLTLMPADVLLEITSYLDSHGDLLHFSMAVSEQSRSGAYGC